MGIGHHKKQGFYKGKRWAFEKNREWAIFREGRFRFRKEEK